MTHKHIQLTGFIDVPPHRLDEISTALPEHVRLTRLEAGCVSFDVTPDPEIAGRFNVAEIFASRVDFDTHQTRSKSTVWAQITQGIARSYTISESD